MPKIHLVAQIMEVERELELRRRGYGEQVRRGAMKQAQADLHIRQMSAVLETLRFIQLHENEIRAYMAEKREREGAEASSDEHKMDTV